MVPPSAIVDFVARITKKGLAAKYTDLISGFARSTADTNCPEGAGPGLTCKFPDGHEECHGFPCARLKQCNSPSI